MSELTQQEVLLKALDKAVANGFDEDEFDGWNLLSGAEKLSLLRQALEHCAYYSIIFRPSFAEALWGDDEYKNCRTCHRQHYDQTDMNDNMPPWEYHLQEMVIADDPIEYLRSTLDEG
jgi:hypothetical protein